MLPKFLSNNYLLWAENLSYYQQEWLWHSKELVKQQHFVISVFLILQNDFCTLHSACEAHLSFIFKLHSWILIIFSTLSQWITGHVFLVGRVVLKAALADWYELKLFLRGAFMCCAGDIQLCWGGALHLCVFCHVQSMIFEFIFGIQRITPFPASGRR